MDSMSCVVVAQKSTVKTLLEGNYEKTPKNVPLRDY